MKKPPVPSIILFLYDCGRLGAAFSFSLGGSLLPFIAVNAFFPIMSALLLINKTQYREYSPLYAAGKIIFAFAAASYFFFALKSGVQVYILWKMRPSDIALFFIMLLDILSALFRLLALCKKTEAENPVISFQPIAEIAEKTSEITQNKAADNPAEEGAPCA